MIARSGAHLPFGKAYATFLSVLTPAVFVFGMVANFAYARFNPEADFYLRRWATVEVLPLDLAPTEELPLPKRVERDMSPPTETLQAPARDPALPIKPARAVGPMVSVDPLTKPIDRDLRVFERQWGVADLPYSEPLVMSVGPTVLTAVAPPDWYGADPPKLFEARSQTRSAQMASVMPTATIAIADKFSSSAPGIFGNYKNLIVGSVIAGSTLQSGSFLRRFLKPGPNEIRDLIRFQENLLLALKKCTPEHVQKNITCKYLIAATKNEKQYHTLVLDKISADYNKHTLVYDMKELSVNSYKIDNKRSGISTYVPAVTFANQIRN